MIFQYGNIAIVLVHVPRNDDISRAPRCSATSVVVGCGVGHITVYLVLCIADVANPFGIKRRHIKTINRRTGRNLSIAGVATAFAMRTITGHSAVHVTKLSVAIVFQNPVKKFVGTFKSSGLRNICIHHTAFQVFKCQFLRRAININITESVPGKTWFPNLFSFAFQDVGIGLAISRTKFLGKYQFDFCPFFTPDFDSRPTRNHPAKVVAVNSFFGLRNRNRFYCLSYPVGW